MMKSQFNCIPPATGIYLRYIPYSIITNDIKVLFFFPFFLKNGHLNFHNQIRLMKIILWVLCRENFIHSALAEN